MEQTNKIPSTKQIMKNHYDVGIYGWWGHENFGGCLTYFALENVIKSLGYSVLMIQEALGLPGRYKITDNYIVMRHAKKHYHCSAQLDFSELPIFNSMCDTFVVGGDQLWNYNVIFSHEDSFLSFADDSKLTLSYSTSFGGLNDHNPPDHVREMASKYLKRFDAISVRENYAVDIAKNIYDVDAVQVIDAVFLPDVSEYEKIIEEDADCALPKKYLLAFILDPTPEKRRQIEIIAKKLNLEILAVPDAAEGTHPRFYEVFDGIRTLHPLSIANFLKAYRDSSYVVTDSFHGTCMSYIFKKDFNVYYNEQRGSERFISLMSMLKLDERRIRTVDSEQMLINNSCVGSRVRWNEADANVRGARDFALKWLADVLSSKHVCRPSSCIGCGACVSVCPKECVKLVPDRHGFYRASIDQTVCIKCNLCKKVCPALSPEPTGTARTPKLYEFVAADEGIVTESSSGGIFSVMAKKVLDMGGAVVGAAWQEDHSVAHVIVERHEDLWMLRKSKYLQSYLGDTPKRVKALLDGGRTVLFTGCPCQVAGLKKYLRRDYENLIVADILCAGAPSALFFKKYLEDEYGDDIKKYTFRYKDENQVWNCNTTKAELTSGATVIKKTVAEDAYQRAFHSHMMSAPHCENCKFQGRQRHGDITIGDFWGIEKKEPSLDTKKGVSALIVNNDKGASFINSLDKEDIKLMKKVPLDWIGYNGMMQNNRNFAAPERDSFFEAILTMPFSKALETALNIEQLTEDCPVRGKTVTPLQFRPAPRYFKFEPDIWTEESYESLPVLRVIPENPGLGHYASMRMDKKLSAGKTYILSVKFKYKTQSREINFHVKSALGREHQVIHTYHNPDPNAISDWVELQCEFVPNRGIYDEIMFGAGHFIGKNNFITFKYIYVTEKQ